MTISLSQIMRHLIPGQGGRVVGRGRRKEDIQTVAPILVRMSVEMLRIFGEQSEPTLSCQHAKLYVHVTLHYVQCKSI